MLSASLKTMLEYWKQFNLPELQKELDGTATELASRQDDSEASRKKLVELSREFKKNTPDETRKLVAPLLKSFQAEVDALSKRSKNAETSFLNVYKKLSDIPDPVAVLEHANQLQKKAHKVQDLEVENRQLKGRLDEYNSEFAEVKNQEVTIKQLREKLKEFEEKLESTAQAKAKEKEKDLQRLFSEKERHLQETQMVVAKKLGEAEHQVAVLQSALNSVQSETLDLKTKYDEALTAKSDEMDMLMADAERANERAMSFEREVEHLRQQLLSVESGEGSLHELEKSRESVPDMEHAINILKRSSLEVELAAKEKEVAQLVEDIQRMQSMANKMRDTSSSLTAKLEEELASKTRSLAILEEKLNTQSDYDELKRELSVLKSLEFAGSTGDESSSSSAEDSGKAKSLETLLLEKNRVLQTENTQLKVSSAELNGRFGKLQEQYTEAFGTIQEQKQLITQLEEDLRSVNALSVMFRGDAEGEAVTSSSQNAEFVASLIKDSSQSALLSAVDPAALKAAADSILPIVQSQRERFRLRAQELESVTLEQGQKVQILQNEMDKLRSDNVKLYEKIKFLQGYASKKETTVGDDTVSKYSHEYNERLDPFASFSRHERTKKYMELKPYDKIALGMGKFIIGNKMARMFVFFYSILLHVLVFLVLYKLAYTSSCQRENAAEDWHKKFAEHMEQVHGGTGGHHHH